MIKRLLSLILILVCVMSLMLFSGCTAETFNLYFGINEMPKNIDPQKAQNYGELLAVRNCFRGLYKSDAEGNAIPDLAEVTKISDDGLTYTFTLADAVWKDETPVTADDFVFAVERASDPVTASPSAYLLTNIVGVPERLSGNGDGNIGVTASDGKTLTVKLIKSDKTFLSKLTQSVFMPCNREFFENCKGKYGLSREHTLTNGIYYPSQWTENRHLKITLVNKEDETKPQNVYITVSSTGKNNIQRIKDDEIGMTVDNINDYSGINENEYTISTLYQKNYAIVFNKNTEVGGNQQLTGAFAKAIHRELFSINMDDRFVTADACLPEDCIVLNRAPEQFNVPKYGFELDTKTAREDFLEAVAQLKNKKLPDISVLCVENDEVKSVLNDIVSSWQSNLGAYVNITTVSSEQALSDRVQSGNYTVALVPLTGSATDILSNFANKPAGMYLGNEEFDSSFAALSETDDRATAIKHIEECLDILSSESSVIPVISVPTAYVYNSDYQNVHFSLLDGTVDFSIIYKEQ